MNNEKLIGKIRKASRFGMIAIPAFIIIPFIFIIKSLAEDFTAGGNSYEAGMSVEDATGLTPLFGDIGMVLGGITAIILFFIMIYILINIYRILIWINKSSSPFEVKFIKELHDIGVALMIFEPVKAVSTILISSSVTLDFLVFSLGVLLFIISQVFRYGTELQKESDETL